MNVLVTGAAGMLGRAFITRVLADGSIAGRRVDELVAVDVVEPTSLDPRVTTRVADLATPGAADELAASRPELVVHLAAVVSGEAEADLEKGYRVNLDGTRALFDALRRQGHVPRVVYASSIAVFGAPFPDVIDDDVTPTPKTSYGTQKLMGELLLNDYSRRGLLDGVGLRLPTLVVRPGAPNRAASGFFSSIIREPLAGHEAVLPVDDDVRHWIASPESAVGFLLHAAGLDTAQLGARRCLTMPGVSVSVAEMIETLRAEAGNAAVALIRREPDEAIRRIVADWPRAFAPERALAAGFTADADFTAIVRTHLRSLG